MEIVLIRHGEPEWSRDGLAVGNPPLTQRGHHQAAAMADHLRHEQFDEVLVSPLVRARQTAAPLLAALAADERIDPWLEEIRNPMWHGTPQEKVDEAYRQQNAKVSHERWEGIPGGEHPRDFVDRIRLGCELFLAERGIERIPGDLAVWHVPNPDLRLALVAHAGTNSVVICTLLGLPPTPWEWDRFVIGHATVSRLRTLQHGDGHSFSLTSLSEDEYLARTDRTF